MNSTTKNTLELSVSELSFSIKNLIEDNFGYVRVKGEIGRVSNPTSGHVYFDLKDKDSIISGIVWKGNASSLEIQPEEGLEVVCTGKVTTYKGQSKYQIIVDNIEPAGLGALMALLEKRKKAFSAEGLFSNEFKQNIPFLPNIIGVVTSPSGSVIRDIIHRINDRFPCQIIVWPVRVQGETCPDEVADAIDGFHLLEQSGIPNPDLIIVARGGGSVEDLWGFNDEKVVRSVFRSKIPIISAIGHETDNTLIDLVADLRAPTPTAAAEKSVPVKNDLIEVIDEYESRYKNSILRSIQYVETQSKKIFKSFPEITNILKNPFQKIENLSSRLTFSLKSSVNILDEKYLRVSKTLRLSMLSDKLTRLDEKASSNYNSLGTKFGYYLKNFKNRLNLSSGVLGALSHEKVLKRGFAIVKDDDFSLIRSSKDIKNNQSLNIQFSNNDVLIAKASLKNKE
ncbi:MAG: exodeoxyribonuclease VII large subunit [Rhodobiaceae bacterium]|nr:exodeoxyribonuclease VII large subunit [Rhodobiaceae bacterium]